MESDKTSNKKYKETLVYLDFNDKIPQEVVDDKIFIRIANLEDKSPLVQINDMVFKGSYDYSMGTNLFFKKTEHEGISEFPFQQPIKFQLEFFEAPTKILNCKQMRVPPTTAILPEVNDKVTYNFKWDYDELLNRFEQGTLDLKDMTDPQSNEPPLKVPSDVQMEPQDMDVEPPIFEPVEEAENEEVIVLNENPPIDIPEEPYEELKIAYEYLQILARTPVKRTSIIETVICDPKYSSSYDYRSIECKVLEPPLFSYFKSPEELKNPDVYETCVDINRCSTLGLIVHTSNFPRMLTVEERQRIFTIENFENLNLTARYAVLLTHKEALEKQVTSNTFEDNSKKDEFGRTSLDTLEIFKKLLSSLQRRIQKVSLK